MIGTIDCANQKRRRKYLLEKALATSRVKEAEGTGFAAADFHNLRFLLRL